MLHLTNYFSALDRHHNEYLGQDDQTGDVYNQFEIESEQFKHKNLTIHPHFHPVSVVVEYREKKDWTFEVDKTYTYMYVEPNNQDTPTPCPICGCSVEQMTIEQEEGDEALTYIHDCGFSKESVDDVICEVLELNYIESLEGYPSSLKVDWNEEGQFGFSDDGSHYTTTESGIYHFHYHEEDIFCSFCSKNEPYEKWGESEMVYQLCPVLTKKKDTIKAILSSLPLPNDQS